MTTTVPSPRSSRKVSTTASARRAPARPRKKVPSNGGRKSKPAVPAPARRGWWKETPRWVLWAVTGLVAMVYVYYMYTYQFKPYFYRWDFGTTYAGHPVVHGIDISHHQGRIDWQALAQAENEGSGIHFVFMKATEGSDWVDSAFCYNFREARATGLLRGAYHFFSPLSPAGKQADFFISQVRLQPNDLPPVLDVERRGTYSLDSLRLEVKQWLHKVEAHYGVKPIIYTSRKFKERYLNDSVFDRYPFWIAHYYVDSLSYAGPWAFWQHTDRGRLPGIGGFVDMNVFNGNMDALKQLTLKPDSLGIVPPENPAKGAKIH